MTLTLALALASQFVAFRLPPATPVRGTTFVDFSAYRGIEAAAFDGSRLYIAGGFVKIDRRPFHRVAAWDGAHWIPLGTGIENGLVHALLLHGSMLYVAGHFTLAGGRAVNSIARWNGAAWEDLDGGLTQPYVPDPDLGGTFTYDVPGLNPDGTAAGRVFALAFLGNDLIAAGYFTHAGGTPALGIARWDGTGWHSVGTGLGADPAHITALAVYRGRLIAAGNFIRIGGVRANCIAEWDGARWLPLGPQRFFIADDRTEGAIITSLAADGDNLYVAGAFNRIDSLTTGAIARWDGSAWHALGAHAPDAVAPSSGTISPAVAVLGPNLFVTAQSGELLRFDGAAWHSALATPNEASHSSSVLGLAVARGLLFASGNLPGYHDVAVFDGTGWWQPSTPNLVETLRDLAPDLLESARPLEWPVAILLAWFGIACAYQFILRRRYRTPPTASPESTAASSQKP